MTDEEKDIYDICLKKKSIYCLRTKEETCEKCKTYKMYKLGLAEGRKEKRKVFAENCRRCSRKKNEELSNSVFVLVNSVTELEKKVTELKQQIEKMKCCENCKHSYTDSENLVFCRLPFPQEDCKSCKLYNHKETDKNNWELAEN